MLAVIFSGCVSSRNGASTTESAREMAVRIVERNIETKDVTLAGRFILEGEKGSRRGSLRIRYLNPDLYRVDVFQSGAAGVGGATSFLVEGDSSLVYADPGGGPERSALERESVLPFLEDFDLQIDDLKALAVLTPYLGSMDLTRSMGSRVRGGYLLEGPGPNDNIFTVWLDTEKEAVVRGQRGERGGIPVVEAKLSRFRHLKGFWRATRVEVRHFSRDASLSVQYERISVNEGLTRDDLLLRGMAS